MAASRPRSREPQATGSSLSNNPALSFVPWVVFWIVAGPKTWELGSALALLASVVLLVIDVEPAPLVDRAVARSAGDPGVSSQSPIRVAPPKILDVGTTAFFLALVIIGLFVPRHDLIGLEKYSQAISSAALCLIVVFSLMVGHPFTEQYARSGVPPEVARTPLFHRIMVTMSAVWALIFAVMAICGLIAETGVSGAGTSNILNWYIPIGLVIIGFKFNQWYPARVREMARRRSGRRDY